MKTHTLATLISLALLIASPSMSADLLDPTQLLTTHCDPPSGSNSSLLPGDLNLDPSLFTLETFVQIIDPTIFNCFTDEDIQEIPADAFGGFSSEQFMELPVEVFDSFTIEQFVNLLPEVLVDLDSERFGMLPADVIGAMTLEQIGLIPRAAIDGMTEEQFAGARVGNFLSGLIADNMGGLPPEVIDDFDNTDFAQLDKTECLQLPSQDLSKLLTNLSQNNFAPADIKECLPQDWILDETSGALTPPLNSLIFLDVIPKPANLPAGHDLPDIFNMKSGLAVGGREGQGNALDGINKIIETLGLGDKFAFNQKSDDGGILTLEGLNEFLGTVLAFMPDSNGTYYLGTADPGSSAGFSQNPENGAFHFFTELGLNFSLLPAPRNPVKMIEALILQGVQGEVKMADSGVVVVPELPDKPYPFAFMLDMLVSSDPGFGPGLHINPQGDGIHWLVDMVGNAQKVHPTLPEPEELESLGKVLDISILHQTDGSFKVLLEGLGEFTVKPTFEVETRQLADGEVITPGFGTDSNGKFAFITLRDEMVIILRLLVLDPDGNTLDL